MTPTRMSDLLREITYKPGTYVHLRYDEDYNEKRRYYIQAQHERIDVVTGEMGIGWSGKRPVQPQMVEGEFVRAVFGLLLGLEEHECREWFKFAGKRIFGPHISLDALLEAADQTEMRVA